MKASKIYIVLLLDYLQGGSGWIIQQPPWDLDVSLRSPTPPFSAAAVLSRLIYAFDRNNITECLHPQLTQNCSGLSGSREESHVAKNGGSTGWRYLWKFSTLIKLTFTKRDHSMALSVHLSNMPASFIWFIVVVVVVAPTVSTAQVSNKYVQNLKCIVHCWRIYVQYEDYIQKFLND